MLDLVRALERAEIDAASSLHTRVSDDIAEAGGLGLERVGGATLLIASRLDVLALNRLVGFGLDEPWTPAALDDALAAMTRSGSPRMFVQVAPVEQGASLVAALEARGVRHYNNWVRLHRDLTGLETLPARSDELVVRAIGPADAETFGRIVAAAFGFPPQLVSVVRASVGQARWRHYLAWHGETPVAAAAMYVRDDTAWFGLAATDESHRRRGAQRALVLQRLRDAASAGCRRVSVETAEDSVTRDAPSFRNLRRLGFEVVYTRANHLWTRPPTT